MMPLAHRLAHLSFSLAIATIEARDGPYAAAIFPPIRRHDLYFMTMQASACKVQQMQKESILYDSGFDDITIFDIFPSAMPFR